MSSSHHDIDLIIVGCGKSKRLHPAPACDIYTGGLFCAKRKYAEASGVPWMIASAQYHLVFPGQTIEPYDLTLPQLTEWELWWWRWRVRRAIEALGFLRNEPLCIELHAGAFYRQQLKQTIARWYPHAEFLEPTARMGIGKQLGWYRQQREERLVAESSLLWVA